MSYESLSHVAGVALQSVDKLISEHGKSPTLESIRNQMIFIKKMSDLKQNPVLELSKDQRFTYGIISSKEFSTDRELKVKELLDNVTNELRNLSRS